MRFKIHLIIAFAITILISCQLLRKEKLTLKKLDEKEAFQVSQQHNILAQQSQLVLVDSSHSDFTMMLYPKGKFTLSIANGFEGEADKILLKGKYTRQKVINLKEESKQDSTSVKANYTNKKERITATEKNNLSVGYNWVWVLILIIILPIIWLYNRFKK